MYSIYFKNQIHIKNFVLVASSEENKSYNKIANIISKILKKKIK